MANEATILRIRAQVENLEGLNRARSAVRNFATESKAASNDLDKLRSMFKQLGDESVRSVNNLKNYRTGLDALRQSAEIGSTTFNELTSEIKQLDIELGSLQGKQAQVASGFNKIASSANAAATATRRQFDLSGAGATFGRTTVAGQTRTIRDTTQYTQPIGPLPVDYAAVNKGLTQAVQAEQQLTELSRRARQERLLTAEKYNNLEIAAADKKAREELRIQQQGSDRALADFDRRLAARGKNKGNLQKFGQTAGAIAASGVFGGPEGLAGAGIGAFFGPGGALAGGAIGAQVGMLRQAIGNMTEYAAQIGRLQIALQGVTKTSAEYASAQEAIFRVSRDLNVPTLEATKGFTQLSASVLGAGGKVNDAELVFRAFTQAIKATGGGAEEVNGVMTALTQIFAKGKISAEEINQIAERLPGAFNAIAKATGMSGAQLQEALKKGEIGLNDLMKTAQYLTNQYSASADRMAKSTDDAGARMKVALDELGKNFGEFFKPVGAGIQDLITKLANFANEMFRTAQLTNKLKDFSKGLTPANESALTSDAEKIARLRVLDRNRRDVSTNKLTNDEQGRVTQAIYGSSYGALSKSGGIYGELRRDYMTKQLYGLKAIAVPTAAQELSTFKPPKVGDTVGGGTKTAENAAKREASQAAKEALRLKNSLGSLGIEYSLKKQIYGIDNKIFEANLKGDKSTAIKLEGEKKLAQINASLAKLEFDKLKPLERQAKIADLLLDKAFAQRDTQQQLTTNQVAVAKEAEAVLRPMIQENELLQAKLNGTEREYKTKQLIEEIMNKFPELQKRDAVEILAKNQALKEQETQAAQLKAVYSDIGMSIKSGVVDAIQGAIDGTKTLGEVASSVLSNIANKILDVAINMALFGTMSGTGTGGGLLGGLFKNANGNVFAQNGIVPYAMGGIVDRPMVFPFAKGIGLMGEAGPEAIMPLKRGADGRLGVAGGGGGSTNVTVNVDASGNASVQGDQSQAKQLGVAVSAAVQAELVKQQRPGGLLAGTRR